MSNLVNFAEVSDEAKSFVQDKKRCSSKQLRNHLERKFGYNKYLIRTVVETMCADGGLKARRTSKLNTMIYGINKFSSESKEKTRIAELEQSAIESRARINALQDELEKEKQNKKERIVEVVVKKGNKATQHKDLYHASFKKILDLAMARKNVLMYGRTGSGKTHIPEQVAKTLEQPYYALSVTTGMSEARFDGSRLPGEDGKFAYITTDFVKAYEEGGVFLLDEIDAADPNALLVINSALANKRMSLPKRFGKTYAEKHPDFICMASANTLGTGGSRVYSGRSQLDLSTIDRFLIGKVHVDYDRELEAQLCPNKALRELLWGIRDGIDSHQLERAMSTRFILDAHGMIEFGWSINEVLDSFFLGWREDEANKIKTYLGQNFKDNLTGIKT